MFSNSYVWTQNRLPLSEIINWNQKKEKTTRFWDMSFFLQFRPIYSSLPCLAICSITSQCHRFSSVQKRPTPSDLKATVHTCSLDNMDKLDMVSLLSLNFILWHCNLFPIAPVPMFTKNEICDIYILTLWLFSSSLARI